MSTYELLKFLHVTAAILWIGGGAMLLVFTRMLFATSDATTRADVADRAAALGPRWFGPISGLALLFGVGMVLLSDDITFADAWISIGLAGFLFSSIVGARLIGPAYDGYARATRADDDATAATMARRVRGVAAVDLVVLALVVLAMILKPGA